MQQRSSGSLPLNLVISEMDEFGRKLADLIKPGSDVERSVRTKVRALLREAFRAVQEPASFAVLNKLLANLRTSVIEIGGQPPNQLAGHISRHTDFGALDRHLSEGEPFSTTGLDQAELLADGIESRVNRILDTISESREFDEKRLETRPIQTQTEATELVTSKIS